MLVKRVNRVPIWTSKVSKESTQQEGHEQQRDQKPEDIADRLTCKPHRQYSYVCTSNASKLKQRVQKEPADVADAL